MAVTLVGILVAASFWLLNTYRANRAAATIEPAPGIEIADAGPKTLDELLTQGKPLVLEFYTSASPDCARIAPELARLNATYGGSLFVVKMNATKYPDEAEKHGVRRCPTVIFFDASGDQKASLSGYRDYEALAETARKLGLLK